MIAIRYKLMYWNMTKVLSVMQFAVNYGEEDKHIIYIIM